MNILKKIALVLGFVSMLGGAACDKQEEEDAFVYHPEYGWVDKHVYNHPEFGPMPTADLFIPDPEEEREKLMDEVVREEFEEDGIGRCVAPQPKDECIFMYGPKESKCYGPASVGSTYGCSAEHEAEAKMLVERLEHSEKYKPAQLKYAAERLFGKGTTVEYAKQRLFEPEKLDPPLMTKDEALPQP
jgi:hypothetical protein